MRLSCNVVEERVQWFRVRQATPGDVSVMWLRRGLSVSGLDRLSQETLV